MLTYVAINAATFLAHAIMGPMGPKKKHGAKQKGIIKEHI
jgi:hypothetical protein